MKWFNRPSANGIPTDGQSHLSPEFEQQIAMMGGSRFMLATVAMEDCLKLEFSDGTSATLRKSLGMEAVTAFETLSTDIPDMPTGSVIISGATQYGSALRAGVLHRFSPVNWNMLWNYRPTPEDLATLDFAGKLATGAPAIGKDENGYYMRLVRWPLGRDTSDLSQVRVKKKNSRDWKPQFLE